PSHFEHHSCLVLRHGDRRITLDAGQHRHFSKAAAGSQTTNLALLAAAFSDVNVQRAFHGKVESVSTPFALLHDRLTALVSEQTYVRTHAFPGGVHFPFKDHVQVVL